MITATPSHRITPSGPMPAFTCPACHSFDPFEVHECLSCTVAVGLHRVLLSGIGLFTLLDRDAARCRIV